MPRYTASVESDLEKILPNMFLDAEPFRHIA